MRAFFSFLVFLVASALCVVAFFLFAFMWRDGFDAMLMGVASVALAAGGATLFGAARLGRWRPLTFGVISIMILVLSAIAIPNALTMFGGSKQKRTMADLRTLATAAEAYATDVNRYPEARTLDELAPQLEPTYIKKMPRRDGWRHPLRYEPIKIDKVNQGYSLASPGKDGKWQRERLADYPPGATTSFDADIIFRNGEFIQYPEGAQTQ